MQGIGIEEYGDISKLKIVEVPDHKLSPDEVRIAIKASGVNLSLPLLYNASPTKNLAIQSTRIYISGYFVMLFINSQLENRYQDLGQSDDVFSILCGGKYGNTYSPSSWITSSAGRFRKPRRIGVAFSCGSSAKSRCIGMENGPN
ncbi:hypothetical protein [Paenibacillus lautus]|uniref:hypothetical protein n=1 Tax=Paenibacillus lautus TaxID=1401 RepID=UPI003D293CB6